MLQIELNPQLTQSERAAVAQYLIQHGRLSGQEWLVALRAFDLLSDSTIMLREQTETFAAVYARLVEQRHADYFLEQLMVIEEDVQTNGERLKAIVARTIAQELTEAGLYHRDVASSRYLLAYCYYWWNAFARGYIFELEITRDLEGSGVEFITHDIRDPIERRSRSDLVVLGYEGDIKTSTYFLATARTQVPHHDFYIVRMYNASRRRYQLAVMMREMVWQAIDGDTLACDLEEAPSLLPQAIQVQYANGVWVIVDYHMWKQRVRNRQQEEHNGQEVARGDVGGGV